MQPRETVVQGAVASRYEDLFQRTYDVAEILEEVKNIDEDESNNFIVQILMVGFFHQR